MPEKKKISIPAPICVRSYIWLIQINTRATVANASTVKATSTAVHCICNAIFSEKVVRKLDISDHKKSENMESCKVGYKHSKVGYTNSKVGYENLPMIELKFVARSNDIALYTECTPWVNFGTAHLTRPKHATF